MDKAQFSQLLFKALAQAAENAEQSLGHPIGKTFEIELHGAGHSGALMSPQETLESLFIDPDHFYRVIDVAVAATSSTLTRFFVRVSGHPPSSFEDTWNQPPGMGPFKQVFAQKIESLD